MSDNRNNACVRFNIHRPCSQNFRSAAGYVLVNTWLRLRANATVDDGVRRFAACRPPGIYKDDYLDELFKYHHERRWCSRQLAILGSPAAATYVMQIGNPDRFAATDRLRWAFLSCQPGKGRPGPRMIQGRCGPRNKVEKATELLEPSLWLRSRSSDLVVASLHGS